MPHREQIIEEQIPCVDDEGRRYEVIVVRNIIVTQTLDGVQRTKGARDQFLAGSPRLYVNALDENDTFEIVQTGKVIRRALG